MSSKEGKVVKRSRQDRLIKERVHDPYMTRRKPLEPTICPKCGVVFSGGRWQWVTDIPDSAHQVRCPACHRIHDKVPAGFLTLSGEFFDKHREEIMHLLHNKVEEQKAQHPLKRLMNVEDQEAGDVVITFTDVHLPRGVGAAIKDAYEGDLNIHYTEEAGIVRVYWRR